MKRGTPLRSKSPLSRHTPLRAKRWGIAPKPARRIKREGAAGRAYLAFVRTLPCCAPSGRCSGRIEANHAGKKPGTGVKAPDITAIPLCHEHHVQWTGTWGMRGAFVGWTAERRRVWADARIAETQDRARALGVLRWKATDPGFRYPPAACAGAKDCPSCPLFRCSKCQQDRPWCFGAADDHPGWCDDCWATAAGGRSEAAA